MHSAEQRSTLVHTVYFTENNLKYWLNTICGTEGVKTQALSTQERFLSFLNHILGTAFRNIFIHVETQDPKDFSNYVRPVCGAVTLKYKNTHQKQETRCRT